MNQPTQPPSRQGAQNPATPGGKPPQAVPNVAPMRPMQPSQIPNVGAQRVSATGGGMSHAGPAAPVPATSGPAGQAWASQSMHPGLVGVRQEQQPVSGQPIWGSDQPPSIPVAGQTMLPPAPQTTGAPPIQVGTTGDPGPRTSLNVTPNKLVIPQFTPIFNRDNPNNVLPNSIELPGAGGVVEVAFEIPRGQLGPYVVIGMYLMLCAPAADVDAGDHPIAWLDPDVGVYSDVEGTPVAPPDTIGPRAGQNFQYSLELANDLMLVTHHGHLNNNLRTIPLPVQIPSGAQGKLTIVRTPNARFREDLPVYLYAGLFGRLHHTVVPPFPLDACRVPVRPQSFTSTEITVPAPPVGTPLGSFGIPVQVPIDVTEQFPTVFSHLLFTGPDHLFMKFSWTVGNMMNDYVPAKVFQYLTAGGWLPAPVLTNGSTQFIAELVQPAVVAAQTNQTAAISIEGASYGF